MAKLGINTGSAPNVGDGDTLIVGAIKINSNFDELYNFLGNGANLNVGIWNKNSVGINTTLSVGIGTTSVTSALTVSGDGRFSGVVTSVTFNGQINSGFGTITNLVSTNITSNNLVGTLATVTTYFGTNLTVTNLTGTNSNTTNLVSAAGTITRFNATSGTVTNLTGTAATITTFNSTNSTTTNSTITNLVGTAGTITNGNIINLTGTAGTVTTFNSTNGTITNLIGTAGSITTLNGTNLNYTGLSTLTTIFNSNIVSSGIVTSSQFSLGANGSAINIDQNTISGPSEIIIDPSGVGDNTGSLRIKGDLYVDGSQFNVSTGEIILGDFAIGIATDVATDLLLDGAGIGIGSDNIKKTIFWNYSSDSLKFSESVNIPTNKSYKIGDTEILTSDQLTISNINSVGISTLITANITNATVISGVITNFTGVACTVTNLSLQQLNVSGVSTLSNIIASNGSTFFAEQLSVSGVSTFNQPTYFNNDVNFSDHGYFIDDKELVFGNSNSFKVYHASTEWIGGQSSHVRDISGNFPVIVGGKQVKITDETGLINYSVFNSVGAEIYQNLNVSGIVTATSTLKVGTGGTVITTTTNGLIGINSTSPSKTLDVIGDVKVGVNTSQGIILTSPNGTQYRLIVDNSGALSTVAV